MKQDEKEKALDMVTNPPIEFHDSRAKEQKKRGFWIK